MQSDTKLNCKRNCQLTKMYFHVCSADSQLSSDLISDVVYDDSLELLHILGGVNEENISFRDPFEEAQEQRAIEMAIMASARYYNVTSVVNVRQ